MIPYRYIGGRAGREAGPKAPLQDPQIISGMRLKRLESAAEFF
jgi:hypothetical protein